MSGKPERIYNWLDTHLSVARYYGGCTFNGAEYRIDTESEGHPLVRVDVLRKERKKKKALATGASA